VFAALEQLLVRDKSHAELLALYTDAAQNAADSEQQKTFYFKIAEIQERAQTDLTSAISTFRQILDVDPSDVRAVSALDELLSRESRWQELAELLEKRVDDAADPTDRAHLRYRLGKLRAERLDNPEGAIEAFEAIVQEKRDHRDAISALEQIADTHAALRARIVEILEPLYRELDDWPKLIVVLNARLEAAHDAIERGAILREIAQLKERRARDISGAFTAYGSAFAGDAGDGEARAQIERLAAEHSLWDELVKTYEAAFAGATDVVVKADLLKAVAETHDTKRDDPRAAIEAYERLYALDDGQLEALDLLQGLHVLLSDWEGLVRVLERKVERSLDDDQRKALLHEIGEYQRDMLGNSDAAVEAFKRALELDPNNGIALEALDDLYSGRNEHHALADVLRQRLEIDTEAESRKALALRLGRLQEKDLNDPPAAIDAYRRALEDAPTESEALLALDRLYQSTHAHADLLENLKTQVSLAPDESMRVTYCGSVWAGCSRAN
jgi:tetratricopeptide (TPR) repeat protein